MSDTGDKGITKMTETERLRIQLQAAEAEILRLQSGYDQLRQGCEEHSKYNDGSQWDAGWCAAHKRTLREINVVTKPL